jgi:hypothetical protein
MNKSIKQALMAIGDQRSKIEIPNFDQAVYIRPIKYVDFFELSTSAIGETEEERDQSFDVALCAHSLVDEDDKPIFTAEEYKEFIAKTHYTVALAIVRARNEVNNFSDLDADAKKK